MFGWSVESYGDFRDVMAWKEVETPRPAEGEALVRVAAAGVSFALLLKVAGKYQTLDPLPFVPGTDIAGEVVEVGPGSKFVVGQRVAGVSVRGAFAEFSCLPNHDTFVLPEAMPEVDGAAYLNAYQTSYMGLKHHGRLAPGEWLLVHGAAGALGLAAVQLGTLMGARVIATAGSAEKLAVCREHGAEHAINYREDDFVAAVQDVTGGHGADVIYDPVGGDVFDQSRRCIAFRGRLIVVGFTSGRIPEIAANRMLLRTFSVDGYTLNAYRAHAPHLLEQGMAELLRLYTEDGLRPVVSEVLPMRRLPDAFARVAERQAIGKIVMVPD